MYVVSQLSYLRSWLEGRTSLGLQSPGYRELASTTREEILMGCIFTVYSLARLGNLILIFTSLRALPAGSFISIDWIASVPHI
jgi:hypothetical protein